MAYVVKWVRLNKFEDLTGFTPMAVYKKIDKGQWPEETAKCPGAWRKADDGHVLVNLEWYDSWAGGRLNAFMPAHCRKALRSEAAARSA